jgi:hypothetical protein
MYIHSNDNGYFPLCISIQMTMDISIMHIHANDNGYFPLCISIQMTMDIFHYVYPFK